MSIPKLRQPKFLTEEKITPATKTSFYMEPQNYLIVSLKDGKKLVVTSDAYHGILNTGELFRCVFCEIEMVRDVNCKERHKTSENHRKILEIYPHIEDFNENLIRKLNQGDHYCTICNEKVTNQFLYKHIAGEIHVKELQMAIARGHTYKPNNEK